MRRVTPLREVEPLADFFDDRAIITVEDRRVVVFLTLHILNAAVAI